MKPLTLPIIVFWAAQAGAGWCQDTQSGIDELAAGLDDFAPSVQELPLDEIADDFGAPDSLDETPPPPPQAPVAETTDEPPAAPAAVIPDGWTRHSRLGMSFATPPEWQIMDEDDDEITVGTFNQAEKRAIAVGVEYQPSGRIDRFERDMEKLPADAGKDLGIDFSGVTPELTYPEPIVAPDGNRLLRKRFVLRKDDFYFYSEVFYKENFNERGGTDALNVMAVNMPETKAAPLIEQVVASIELESAPPPEPQISLGGLVTYDLPMPKGWKRYSENNSALIFLLTPVYSASLIIETGRMARSSFDSDGEFETPPEITRGEIFGQPASVKSGMMPTAQMQIGARMVKGLRTVYQLDMCLANGDPIVIQQYAVESWLESTGYGTLMDALTFSLPDDAAPCPATETTPEPAPLPVAAPPPSAPAASDTPSGWTVYANSRFGTTMRYPTSHFQPVGEPPANNDGRSFASPDGQAEMLVWGGYNALEQTVQQMMDEARGNLPAAQVIDQKAGANWFTVRLRDGDLVVHQHGVMDGENIVHSILVRYPATQQDRYAAVTDAMIGSLSVPAGVSSATPPPTPPAPRPAGRMEQAFWQTIEGTSHVANFEAYLQQWPNGAYAAQARQRLKQLITPAQTDPQMELAFWQSIQASSDPAMYQAYLERWPNGTFAVLARLSLQRLNAPAPGAPAQASPPPASIAAPAPAARQYYTPARNTAERQAVMDAARVPMLRELRQDVIFLVKELRTDGQWCFLMAEPLQPNGNKLNWYTTPYANDWAKDAMSDVVMVLMRKQANGWQAVDYVIGPTDVHWYNWIDKYGLSERLFTSG